MWQSIPDFGTALILAILVAAAYTFALAVVAARRRPRWLPAARQAAFGTVALSCVAVLVLAYAFISHDFRIRYVAHYSDRSMPVAYLISSLWGGQDGSILWWQFLLSGYIAACLWWVRGRYLALQPYIIATLMVIVMFFAVLMIFSANPFSTSIAAGRADGEGLNPLLQNFYMAIHPPSLYLGFVGCSIPFAFAMSALISGRLDSEWIVAVRKWMLFAWLFLSIGNALGMLWAYVELGWGGYWAWDPVENAAFLPWLTSTAYVHSTMVQERRAMLKVWNLFLICLTFFLTIFGTFLTRSGAIVSVHAFAQSNIGTYFIWFLGLIAAASVALILLRLPQLRSEGRIESAASREAAFLANNWALLGATVFVLVATTFPLISKALFKEAVTVGPPFYNRWMVPIGLSIFLLMGVAPLFGWRKTSPSALKRAFIAPASAALLVAIAHVAFGDRLGFPAFVPGDPIVPGALGIALEKLGSATPLITATLAALNITVVIQEFWRGVAARRKGKDESIPTALINLVSKARRRYGGYVVHFGITLMFIGFLGQAWGVNKESSLKPGGVMIVDRYAIRYDAPRSEVDPNKRMSFVDLTVLRAGSDTELGRLSPAKFAYKKNPEMPTTEIAVLHSVRDDLYVVLGSLGADKTASLQVHINPLVSWIWLGVLFLIFGASISLWPDVPVAQLSPWAKLRLATSTLVALALALLLASMPARAFAADSTSSISVVAPRSLPSSHCDNPAPSVVPREASICVPEAR
jgi:cytochrome c-type biogenesis protein CcmF